MNLLKTIVLLLALSTLSSNAQGHVVKSRLKKIVAAFNALSESDKKHYLNHKRKAFEARKNEKYLSCLVEINDAQKIFEEDMDLLFLKGICHAQLHDVDNAVFYYEKVLQINHSHMYTLLNMVEINFFAGRYKETIKYINKVNSIIESRANGQHLPLLDFKHLISLAKLSEKEPQKYKAEMDKVKSKYTFMDDNPFYYYANALESFTNDDKQEGLVWILKAYLIFQKPQVIEVWNKALVDTDYIGAHEIMFNRIKKK